MQLSWNGYRFELVCNFSEKELAKQAGFVWDSRFKKWYTGSAEIAKRFEIVGDKEAKERIASLSKLIAESQAIDSNLVIPVPSGKEYLPFQKAGIGFALKRENTLIADEMGLGKTVEAIGVINADPTISRVLIVCPASVKINWQREINNWLVRRLSTEIATSTYLPETNIVIINYEIVKKHRKDLEKRQWDLIVMDEAHYVKSPDAQRTKALLGSAYNGKVVQQPLKAKRRLFLTGTPILNKPVELWPILRVADPSGLGASHWLYVKKYCGAWKSPWGLDCSGATNLPELQSRLRSSFMIRRLKKDVMKDLPAKRRQIITLPVTALAASAVVEELEFYNKNAEIIEQAMQDASLSQALGDEQSYREAAMALKSAQKIMFEKMAILRRKTAEAKLPFVFEYIDDVLEQEEKLVVFAHHRSIVEAIDEKYKGKAVKFYGGMSTKQKDEAIQKFISDKNIKIFVASISAGGIGIDGLQKVCSTALFCELDWRPPVITQAEDRLSRIGQTLPVTIQHLCFDGSLDAAMAKRVLKKQDIIDAALDKPKLKGLLQPV